MEHCTAMTITVPWIEARQAAQEMSPRGSHVSLVCIIILDQQARRICIASMQELH